MESKVQKKMTRWNSLFPKSASNNYNGYNFAKLMFFVVTLLSFVRSCIHIFAADGGAGSIAGLDITGESGGNLIAIFSIWGLSQLLLAIIYGIIAWRYQNLIPIASLTIFLEYTGRLLIGCVKPLVSSHTVPGAVGNYILIPFSLIMFIFALRKPNLAH